MPPVQPEPHTPFHAGLVWMRRDLRAHDHAALYAALRQCRQVHAAFVFDSEILAPLPRCDRRVEFIRESLVELDSELRLLARQPEAGLIVLQGAARQVLPALAAQLGVQAVFASHDDEPQAHARDAAVRGALANQGIAFHTRKDQVIFSGTEVLNANGQPYGAFAPYKNAWLAKLEPFYVRPYPVERYAHALAPRPPPWQHPVPALADIGFSPTNLLSLRLPPGSSGARQLLADFESRIDHYDALRDYPARKGPSYLGTHLRFGTLSVRQLAGLAWQRAQTGSAGAAAWLCELIWRDFYCQILHHHPHVAERAFKPAFDAIAWEKGVPAQRHFKAWCDGETGYPLVDAAMRQLAQTGYMHNRLRMITASFLVKHLGIDWRRGERHFAQGLNDFDLSANNGGWQWAASTGCDAPPYFRIFNPVRQSQRFDAQGQFIRRYLPELARLSDQDIHAPWKADASALRAAGVRLGRSYPQPMIDHAKARAQTLARYAKVKGIG